MATMRIYVGTYGKYNSGSIAGAWLDLADYGDKEDFMLAAKELHADEPDAELMFQDFEGIPKGMCSEYGVDAEVWDLLAAYDEHDEGAVNAYCSLFGAWDESDFQDRYSGEFKDDADFAYDMAEQCGYLSEMPEHLQSYFDYSAFARDLMYDYCTEDGYYFRNC